jgi:16S rRNA (guanine527-N7)-methyltransferase
MRQNNKKMSKEQAQFDAFATQYGLSEEQKNAFKIYYDMLIEYNSQHNLTTLTDPLTVIRHHFSDSLELAQHCDVAVSSGIVDVGTGGGFPGIPLKIAFPDVPLVLIETNGKKRFFLEAVCKELGLSDVTISHYDWRTFIRITDYAGDLFVSRAALPVSELCRMFKPSSPYNEGVLVYWASESWEPEKKEHPFVDREVSYRIGSRTRRLIFFKRPVE